MCVFWSGLKGDRGWGTMYICRRAPRGYLRMPFGVTVEWAKINLDCLYLYVCAVAFLVVFNSVQVHLDTCPAD